MTIEILRLGHRLPRDERISTHVALVARAFGASSIAYSGQHDEGLELSVSRIVARWGGRSGGGDFPISYERNHSQFIKKRKREGYVIVHLTMYGIPIMKALERIRKAVGKEDEGNVNGRDGGKILIVVGSEAVPSEVYHLADFNVSVTSQPHSEVAALAIALDRLMEGQELERDDFSGDVHIEPCERGKRVIGKKTEIKSTTKNNSFL